MRREGAPVASARIRSGKAAATCTDMHRVRPSVPEAPHSGPWRGSVSTMKKLINAVDNVVTDALRGMAAAHPHELDIDLDQHIVYRRRPKEQGKVAIISGGGSGHEPLHGGFVGTGMLDAACAGEIFTSPVPDQVVAATSAVDRGAGVLHIVKNYTGDVMNFEMAAEIVDAESGIQVASVVTNDDVAVEDSLYTAGRRGVGVTVMVEKIAGAAAEQGRPLDEVAGIAARVNAAGRSMGMALTSCTVPANGKPSFDLPEGEMEIGIGIHGEPGRHREKIAPAAEIAEATWIDPTNHADFEIAPLLRTQIFPALTPANINAIAVFAGAREGTDPNNATLARSFGEALARHDITLVYGGSKLGLMGEVARGSSKSIGVLTHHLAQYEIQYDGLERLEMVDTLAERKARMSELSDAIVALPGGAGTLDELFDEWTNQQLGLHRKPIGLLGRDFWAPFIAMVDHMVAHGFVRATDRAHLIVADDPDELIAALRAWHPPVPRWL